MENQLEIEEPVFNEENFKISLDVLSNEFSVETLKLNRLFDLRDEVLASGPSIASMEAFEQMYPESMHECAPLFTYTMSPSTVNLEYATESFLSAIADAFKWIIKKIGEILAAIINFFIDAFKSMIEFFKYVPTADGKNKKVDEKEVERVIKEGVNIERDHPRLKTELTNKLGAERMKEIPFFSEKFEEQLKTKFNKQYHLNMINSIQGYSVADTFANMEAVIELQETVAKIMADIQGDILKIADTSIHGGELTDLLDDLEQKYNAPLNSRSDKLTIPLIPFSYEAMSAALVMHGAKLPQNHSDILSKQPKGIYWGLSDIFKVNNTFWYSKPYDSGNHEYSTKFTWGRGNDSFYKWGLTQDVTLVVNTDNIPKESVNRLSTGPEILERKLKLFAASVSKSQSDFKRKADSALKDRAVEKRLDSFLKDSSYSPNKIVWPLMYKGLEAGTEVSEEYLTNMRRSGDQWFYKATDFPEALIRSPMLTRLLDVIMVLRYPFLDAFDMAREHNKMLNVYLQVLISKEEEIKIMEKRLKG